MKIIYKCSNCNNVIDENIVFCPYCKGYANHDSIGAKTSIKVISSTEVISEHFVKVFQPNLKEQEIAFKIIEKLPQLNLIQKTDDYITLEYKNYDIARIRCTNTSRYFKLFLSKKDKTKYKDSLLFKIQKNKKELFWSSDYDENNIDLYIELLKNRINEIDTY